jgi:hypothetical protein
MRLPFRLGHARTLPSPFAFKTTEASEIALTVFVVVIVGMMIIPLPTAVLDVPYHHQFSLCGRASIGGHTGREWPGHSVRFPRLCW